MFAFTLLCLSLSEYVEYAAVGISNVSVLDSDTLLNQQ